ncbi:MAG: aconitate hydratase AcnA [Aeropyrum sp.]|nr:aconitate hydratase AcnA [Aeropyrum sp.]MCE4615616.1 aconitate hydratase AcnA [Aeropyrum sp.]
MAGLKHDFSSIIAELETPEGKARYYRLEGISKLGLGDFHQLPYSIRVLLENVIRHYDGFVVRDEDVEAVAGWVKNAGRKDVPFHPVRVVMQDFTGVPAIVDLAAMRDAMKGFGGDPRRVNPLIPVDLIIDHSIQVDFYGSADAFRLNLRREYERNKERYQLLKWAQKAFSNFRVVPPGKGIIHQVNLEYLAKVVWLSKKDGELYAHPDSLLGTDSHTTMVNALGVFGWGVGGIEAEAVILGQPYYMLLPEVVGVRLEGELREGVTATDLVLYITEKLRKKGVVGKFVEYFGEGVKKLSVPDRATIANMAPEYGATMGYFPIDEATLEYLRGTGRPEWLVLLVERYAKEAGLWYSLEEPEPMYSDVVEIDLADVEPSISGPSNPEDRIPLREAKERVRKIILEYVESKGRSPKIVPVKLGDEEVFLSDGSVVYSAMTSCTNTSNPSVMMAAALLARNAVKKGLRTKPWVKTSNAPGSRVVPEYWNRLGLTPYLEALGFHITGFGCTVCIGNSGPLRPEIEQAIRENDLWVATVLSGNRNFSGRIHPLARGNFLASPPLVVAYALAGRVDIDFDSEPLGFDPNGRPVYLRDLWPSQDDIRRAVEEALDPKLFIEKYKDIDKGDDFWERLDAPNTELFQWDPQSTYIRKPPYFDNMPLEPEPPRDIRGARVLVWAPDRTSTDHISPAGRISPDSKSGQYLLEKGVPPAQLNTCGSRRGNHEVMMRCTFDNPRFRNKLVPDREGGWTIFWPTGEVMHVYDAAMKYKELGVPTIVLAGKQYGVGSSRDWAAKGPALLGVKAVIAESFERIHRSNLVGMGVLPLEFMEGENAESLGLDGSEEYDILGIEEGLHPGKLLTVRARKQSGRVIEFKVKARLDTPVEVEYYKHGGILQYVLRKLIREAKGKN